jgi:Ca2+-binding RTX toxin-like protein
MPHFSPNSWGGFGSFVADSEGNFGMASDLQNIISGIRADKGLKDGQSGKKIDKGIQASLTLNTLLLNVIAATGANADGRIDAKDMVAISKAVYANPADYVTFLEAHGNDEGDIETGFHFLQNDGSTLTFDGRNFVDTVIDAIYHYGFKVEEERFVNEDMNENEATADVAGWLNYFLNGVNIIYGSAKDDEVSGGTYSTYFKAARGELFETGAGNDKIWANDGSDTVYAGDGRDTVGAGKGSDTVYGGTGNDTLWGDQGRDTLLGEDGNDTIGGGDRGDRLDGGAGDDLIYGDKGADVLIGGLGNDKLEGGDRGDRLDGGEGRDEVSGGAGRDTVMGGAGADRLLLWEQKQVQDTLVFAAGDSGVTEGSMDYVENFDVKTDRIDLTGFAGLKFVSLNFLGNGASSAFYDGRYLRIDADGDAQTDMMIEFAWTAKLKSDNFLLA